MGPVLSGPVISLLDSCPSGLWERLHAAAQGAAASAEKTVLQVDRPHSAAGRPTSQTRAPPTLWLLIYPSTRPAACHYCAIFDET